MQIEDKIVRTLNKLGVTPREAKVYFICLKSGRQKINVLSALANMDRSNTYHAIRKLQKIGLVCEILGKPNLYEATALKEAIPLLIEKKEKEYKTMKEEAKDLEELDISRKYSEKPTDFGIRIVTKQKKSGQQEVINACKLVERSFDLIICNKDFVNDFNDLSSYQLGCVERGIKYRVIIQEETLNCYKRELRPFVKYANFKLRYVKNQLDVFLGIADKKDAYVFLSSYAEMERERSQLITDNPVCLKMFLNYFDKVWEIAKEYKPRIRDAPNSAFAQNLL